MTTIVDFGFFTLCGASLFVFRARKSGEAGAWRAPGGAFVPALFVVSSALVVLSAVLHAERAAVLRAGAMLALGIVLFAWWSRGGRVKAAGGADPRGES